jgi:hypothetical protein
MPRNSTWSIKPAIFNDDKDGITDDDDDVILAAHGYLKTFHFDGILESLFPGSASISLCIRMAFLVALLNVSLLFLVIFVMHKETNGRPLL